VSTLQAARRLIETLDRLGVSEWPLARTARLRVRRLWRRYLEANGSRPVRIDVQGVRLTVPRRYLPDFICREYEPLTTAAFRRAIRPGATVIDVGAHLGYYTLLAGTLAGAAGRVHAVEPCPENQAFLVKNIRLNQLQNVHLYGYAAGAARAERIFHITGSSDSHSLYPHPLTPTVRQVPVTEVPLDEIVRGPVDVAKIDVEGAEFEVLAGMERLLAESPSLELGIEWAPACLRNAGRDPAALPGLLRDLGFTRIEVLDDREGRICSLEETLVQVRAGSLPENWYVNLWARARGS
jgi:FkbM family methyltransferase